MSGGFIPTNAPSEQFGSQVIAKKYDLSNVRQTRYFPSGLLAATCMFVNIDGGTPVAGQYAKVVFGAENDADADGRLAVEEAHITLPKGLLFASGFLPGECLRVDFMAALPVGTDKTVFQLVGSVKA